MKEKWEIPRTLAKKDDSRENMCLECNLQHAPKDCLKNSRSQLQSSPVCGEQRKVRIERMKKLWENEKRMARKSKHSGQSQ